MYCNRNHPMPSLNLTTYQHTASTSIEKCYNKTLLEQVSDGYRLLDLETMVRKDMVEERQNDKYFDCDPDDPNCDLYI